MKRLLLSGLMSLTLLPWAALSQPSPFYINSGTVTDPAQIFPNDVINFVNLGLIDIFTQAPFETSNTLNYTNKVGTFSGSGTMSGAPGFRFDTSSTTTGQRRMANSFFNDNGAVVLASDVLNGGFNLNAPCVVAPVDPSYLLVSATNIIVKAGTSGSPKASLIVGANGEMSLEGKRIDISRSGLEVLPVWDELVGSSNGDTNFLPDIAIYDQYWGRTNFSESYTINSRALWDGSTARAPGVPSPLVSFPSGFVGGVSGFTLFNPATDSYINVVDGLSITITNFTGSPTNVTGTNLTTFFLGTNITKGAVFVGAPPDFDIELGFVPSSIPNNFFDTIGVLMSVQISNAVTTLPEPAFIFLQDRLASGGTTGVLANLIGCPATTFRPANYLLARVPFSPGFPGNNGYPEPNFFVDSGAGLNNTNFSFDMVTNVVITNGEFSAYSAFLDNVVSRPPPVPGGTVTNLPGRIRISADSVDMTKTRLRAEGEIIIQTSHLISSSNAVVDCENLSFNLASPTGNLKVQNLTKEIVDRLRGNIYMWSGVWSNTALVIITNNYDFTNIVINVPPGSTNEVTNVVAVLSPLTNTVFLGLHTLMLDATELTTTLPVTVHDLVTHSPNVVIHDNMSVVQSLLIDGNSLTLEGDLTIPGFVPIANPIIGIPPPGEPFENWTFANVPNLLFFTNHGSFFIANEAHFGDDRPAPYSTFVNTGSISAASIALESVYFQNNGTLLSVGPMVMQSTTAKLEDGNSASGGDSQFLSGTLKFNNYQLTVNGGLYFMVTNALFDTGGSAGNTFNVQNGFHLQSKPPIGDLLGTTLQTIAPSVPSIQINHTWAGVDRGPTTAGFADNVAIGKLVLSHVSPDPLFAFEGTGLHNGLYVDLLDLTGLGTDFLNKMEINPNLVIYFASAELGFTPPLTNGASQLPEEYLDGQFGGRLRWVRDFAGPNSGIDVVQNGQSVRVNAALRNSTIIDSDGDGIPNFSDPTPFDLGGILTVQINGLGTVSPDYNGQLLVVGQNYTITANPGLGFQFSNWSGGVSSTSPQLTFTMQSNLVLVANFVVHGFVPAVGSYNGLFYEASGVRRGSSGSFTATTTARGTYSGRLQMSSSRYSFSGQFDAAGAATSVITRKGNDGPLTVALQMEIADNEQITGTITDGNWIADVVAERTAALFAGSYTMIFPGTDDRTDTETPFGDGYGAVTVDQSGRTRLRGTLADGEKLVQTSTISSTGRWPLFRPLYHGQGQILGWLIFTNAVEEDLGGQLSWIKSPMPTARYYPAGFDLEVRATGSAYNAFASPLLSITNGTVVFAGGNLASDLAIDIILGPDNKVINLSGNKLTLKLNTSQGLFKGTLLDPITPKPITFNGAILQKQNGGAGFFLGTNQSGRVTFGP